VRQLHRYALGLVVAGSLLAAAVPVSAATEKQAMAAWAKRLNPAKVAFTKDYEQMLTAVEGHKAQVITSESQKVMTDARRIAASANSPSSSVNALVRTWASDIDASAADTLAYARHETSAHLTAIVQATYRIIADEKAIGTAIVAIAKAHT
jgi:hypothetical protein